MPTGDEHDEKVIIEKNEHGWVVRRGECREEYPDTLEANQRFLDALFVAAIREELGDGYRGYQLRFVAVYFKADSPSLRACIHMFLLDGPLSPKDLMYVDGPVHDYECTPEGIEGIAANSILSIQHYIDLAYDKPEELEELPAAYPNLLMIKRNAPGRGY